MPPFFHVQNVTQCSIISVLCCFRGNTLKGYKIQQYNIVYLTVLYFILYILDIVIDFV